MKAVMKITGVLLALVSVGAVADMTVCKMGDITRRVELSHQDGDSSKPCEAKYYKDTEQPGAEPQLLAKYNVEVAKCKEKTDALIQKLTGMGFNCAAEGASQ